MSVEVRQRSKTEMEIRVFISSTPRNFSAFQYIKKLTVWVAGSHMNGEVIGHIARQFRNVTSLKIERRDTDWDGSCTIMSWNEDDDTFLANGLKDHPALQDFSLVGFAKATPISKISQALCTIPKLASVELTSDHRSIRPVLPSLPADILQQLLQTLSHRMKMIGVFPETNEYCEILQKAYIQDMCRLHIFLHFSDTNSHKPSRFAYYLREVMKLNQRQMGRRDNHVSNSFLKLSSARGRNFSLDCVFLLLRENPWLCDQRNNLKTRRKKRWTPRRY
mmetsp:Transcript_37444/g.54809  ORF Transcript_37444/g.54809 Transcript_37444/m.54809 type:complete len:277 (-) Transcript_37444:217-1047(-)